MLRSLLDRWFRQLFPLPLIDPYQGISLAIREWRRQVEPLGPVIPVILHCCNSEDAQSRWYFAPPQDDTLHTAAHQHFLRLYEMAVTQPAGPSADLAIALAAAGLAACGQRDMIGVVLNHAPRERVVLDHGAGICLITPYKAVARLLPLPEDLKGYFGWIQGSSMLQAVRVWYRQMADQLQWEAASHRYVLAEPGPARAPHAGA
jgi:hypothetical protein